MLTIPVHALAVLLVTVPAVQQDPDPPAKPPDLRSRLEVALRRYFAAEDPRGPWLTEVRKLARGHEQLLAEIVQSKSFVAPTGVVARRGAIDERYCLVDEPSASNPALFHGPAGGTGELRPLAVYVPDAIDSSGFVRSLVRDGTKRGWYVFLVPDERRDNKWNPSVHEHRRHTGPLRDFLLKYPIDPDRVFFVGSGRGGHAAWDVGLMSADRWAALVPCNGGLVHEGGYAKCYGVFLDNAKSLAVFTVYNTTSDHGLDSCRYAVRMFKQWGYRCESVEERRMRVMGLREATQKLAVADVVRDAHPRELLKRFNHLEHGDHYWLRTLVRPRQWDAMARVAIRGKWPEDKQKQRELVWAQVRKQCALLKGSIRDNRIEVVAQGIRRVRVYLDQELVDFDRKVTIVVNGRRSRPRAVARKVEVMLQHVHETGDTARLYWDCVDLPVRK
ncbi:MAG: alpha/beta hydrolase family protein [Planctomycetota bacterium]|jgi:hypothetical protein